MRDIILIYLALGLPVAIISAVAWNKQFHWKAFLQGLFVWAFWPLMPAAVLRGWLATRQIQEVCGWCGEHVVSFRDPDKLSIWEVHQLQCEKHPLGKRVRQLEVELESKKIVIQSRDGEISRTAEKGLEMHNEIQRLKDEQVHYEKLKSLFNRAIEQMRKADEFHPRAMKLIEKGKNFIVVADDEPYFPEVYTKIRWAEKLAHDWSDEDETRYLVAVETWNRVHGPTYGVFDVAQHVSG